MAKERVRLIKALEEFDPSDDYHDPDELLTPTAAYYAAIDRAICLLRGDITSWKDRQK